MFSTRRSRRNGIGFLRHCLAIVGRGALLLLPTLAGAACGLDGCPAEITAPGDRRIYLEHEARAFSYSLFDAEGDYTRYQTRIESVRNGWAFGAFAPVVALRDPAENATELSSVVLFGERTLSRRSAQGSVRPSEVFAFGLQLEIPGSGSGRITNDHVEVLPYVSLRAQKAGATWFAMMGVRVGLNEAEPDPEPESSDTITLAVNKIAHDDEFESLVVNPHERWETTARAGVNLGDLLGAMRLSFYLQGDRVLQGDREGDTFGSAGMMLRLPVRERWAIRPVAEVPFGGLRRFDWNAGVGVRVSL